VKKEPTQLSPVKKRIKENKDHYYADTYPAHHHRSPLQEPYRRQSNIHRNGAPITIHDTPPIAHGYDQHPSNAQHTSSKPIPEVITISDSDDETENSQISKSMKTIHNESKASTSNEAVSSTALAIKQSTPNSNGAERTASNINGTVVSSSGVRNVSSGCPSVMPITPLLSLARDRGQDECYTVQGASSQSTPNCTSRSGVPSCVTVNGDSDEDFQAQQNLANQQNQTPIKQLLTPMKCELPSSSNGISTGIHSKKNRLLAKAQSEWMLSSLKEEHEGTPGYDNVQTSSGNFASVTSTASLAHLSSSVNTSPLRMYESYSRNSIAAPPSVFDDKSLVQQSRHTNLAQRQQQAHELLEQKIIRERERELEIQAAREREARERER